MRSHEVHVDRNAATAAWVVTLQGEPAPVGSFSRREYALAFARAVAHRSRAEMVEHAENGKLIRYPAASLSYPAVLA